MKLLCALALAPLLALAGSTVVRSAAADDDGAVKARRAALGYDGTLIAILDVADLEASIAWYGEHLGLEPILHLTDFGWAELDAPAKGAAIGLGVPQDGTKRPGAVALGVKDVTAAVAKLRAGGIELEGEIVELPGLVKLAKVHDPDGNAITLAESLVEQGE